MFGSFGHDHAKQATSLTRCPSGHQRVVKLIFVLSTLTIVVLALAAVSTLFLPVQGADWPQFLGPARNATSMETNLARTWPKEGPPISWQKNVGEGFSGPVVVAG